MIHLKNPIETTKEERKQIYIEMLAFGKTCTYAGFCIMLQSVPSNDFNYRFARDSMPLHITDLLELMEYEPPVYVDGGLWWFHRSEVKRRIDILKQILAKIDD